MPISKHVNRDFFKTWSPEMAYVLGFFCADGSMLLNNRGAYFIEFQITDLQILRQIRTALQSNHKISIRKRNDKWKTIYRLQIGSKDMFDDLSALGLTQAKTKTILLPKVQPEYVADFVRGYFDGDGNIYFRKHKVKDRRKERWIFSSRFTSGNKIFLADLHQMLREDGIQKGFIVQKQRGFDLVLSHHDSLALFKLMYNNDPRIYLKRKYDLFNRAVATLYGNKK